MDALGMIEEGAPDRRQPAAAALTLPVRAS
jgi:hypothetical protein